MNAPTPNPQDEIPALTSIAPSIFVPITSDLTDPFKPPATRVERIRKVLENVDVHSAAVKANILHMFDQEIARTRREAKDRERAYWETSDIFVGITKEDFELMARNIEAPAERDRAYNVFGEIPRPNYEAEGISQTLREEYARKVLNWVEVAIGQVEGYANHVEVVKAQYQRALEEALEEAERKHG